MFWITPERIVSRPRRWRWGAGVSGILFSGIFQHGGIKVRNTNRRALLLLIATAVVFAASSAKPATPCADASTMQVADDTTIKYTGLIRLRVGHFISRTKIEQFALRMGKCMAIDDESEERTYEIAKQTCLCVEDLLGDMMSVVAE